MAHILEHHVGKWFKFDHLPEELQTISKAYYMLAQIVIDHTNNSAEQTTALRKLLESKDCAVRAARETIENEGKPSEWEYNKPNNQ